MEIIWLITGVVLGAIAAWFALKFKSGASEQELKTQLKISKEREQELKSENEKLRHENTDLKSNMAATEANYRNLDEKLREQKKEVKDLQDQFALQFKNLANEIFEEKNKKSKEHLGEILNPLKEKIAAFEKRVEDSHKESLQHNSALKEQLLHLKELNQQITAEASNLTRALKGDTKAQGNWGEYVLQTILGKSGLRKDEEYVIQESLTTEDGKRYQPDVVVKLPDNKNLIIDSKVSLVAYERYVSNDDDEERVSALKQHILSLRQHIKGLSEKNYQSLYQLGSLDFVLLFIPIEPAFSLAVQNDKDIFLDAYDKNIVMVSPSTLIATLRTIASMWKNERQNKYALEIAKQGGDLYDKFVSFSNDLIKVGEQLRTTKKTYEEAMNKLTDGKGNLVSRVNKLKELGAKASKQMDTRLVDRAEDDEASE